MSELQELLRKDDFRHSLFLPPRWQERNEGLAIIPLHDLLATVEPIPGGYLLISALRKISEWNYSSSGTLEWGFTMGQAFDALQEIGMSEDDAFWFLHLKVLIVPIYKGDLDV